MCLKFPEITCRIGKITLKRPKNRQKIPLFFTTKYLQTIIYINNINIKLTYHMHKYVVIKMKKNCKFQASTTFKRSMYIEVTHARHFCFCYKITLNYILDQRWSSIQKLAIFLHFDHNIFMHMKCQFGIDSIYTNYGF